MKNGKRLLAVKEILQKYSDENHPLTIEDIQNYLENEYGIFPVYRKTLNADIRTLEAATGIEVLYRHKHGYHCEPQPFSLSELKILFDSFDGLRDLDETALSQLRAKCSHFFSVHQISLFEQLTPLSPRKKNPFLYHLEVLLDAVQKKRTVLLTRKTKVEEIIPLFFERVNDRYYLLYSYPQKAKIYRLLFQNIEAVRLGDNVFVPPFHKKEITAYLQETHEAYHGEVVRIEMQLSEESEQLKRWLRNDFPQIEFYRNHAYLRSSIGPRLFATLSAYHNKLRILSPPELIDEYTSYFRDILASYD